MNRRLLVGMAAVALSASSYAAHAAPAPAQPLVSAPTPTAPPLENFQLAWHQSTARTAQFAETLVGLREEDAAAAVAASQDFEWRVVSRQPGPEIMVTMDARSNRIDFWVKDGVVVKVSVG